MKHARFYLVVLLVVLLAVLLPVVAGGVAATSQAQESFTVVIYDALPGIFDDVIAGFQTQMVELGYVEDENITYIFATNGDELAEALKGDVDLVLSIPGGIIFSSGVVVRDTPILFIASRDPVAERLVASLDAPGGPITGVMVDPALEQRLDAAAVLLPEAKTFYVITDSSADGTATMVDALQTLADERELTLVIADVPAGDSDAAETAEAGIPEDAAAILAINTGSVTAWPRVAVAHGLPLISDSVGTPMDYGPLLAYVLDMNGAGAAAAGLAYQMFQGANPAELAVQVAPSHLIIDQRIADAVAVEVPQALLDEAATVLTVEMVGELPPLEVETAGTGGEGEGEMTSASGAACNAILQHPGGKNTVCIVADCEVPLDSGMVRYLDRVPTDGCPTEGLIGICSMEAFDMYHYDGELSGVRRGCMMLQGEWVDPE